jgi:multiple sugar transport system permease protein
MRFLRLSGVYAGAFISILPLVLIFFLAQRQFIEGVALSGVKR